MLLLPSEILKEMKVSNPREYGLTVWKKLLIWADNPEAIETGEMFNKNFKNRSDALQCIVSLRQLIDTKIPLDEKVETNVIFLPATFMRSNNSETIVIEINPKLMLCLLKEGPVIPVILRRNNQNLNSDDILLNHVLAIYDKVPTMHVSLQNIGQILAI